MNDNQEFNLSPSLPILLQIPSHISKTSTDGISQIKDLRLQLSSPRGILSPDIRRANSDKLLQVTENKKVFASPLTKKSNNILFTIQQNYLSRKNHQLMSPRPPKYKPATAKAIPSQQADVAQKSRQRKVVFTDRLVHETRKSPNIRHQSPVTRPIIRNSTKGSDHGDNLSNSSRSLSAQNSFVSQFRHLPRKPQVRHDANHQKFTQILSHFQRNKQQRSRNKLSRHFRQKALQKQQKYTDSIFPPVFTSLFINPARMPSQAKSIQWKRISDLYGNNSVLLSPEGQSHIRIVRQNGSLAEQFLAVALNAVKHSIGTLERIFEGQKYNLYGLYLIRIFQQQHWRSLIVDDFIPVKINSESQVSSIQPAFLSIAIDDNNHPLQLWPHLLEKAFAHYYSAFGLLRFGNTVDFVSQLMGLSPSEILFKKKTEKQLIVLQSSLESVDSFALTEMGEQKKSVILWIHYEGETSSLYFCHSPTFIGKQLTIESFAKLQGTIFLFSPKVYHSLSTSNIGRYSPRHSGQQRSEYSIRRLTLSQTSDVIITLQQKQARFFAQSSLDYHYMWVRAVLVQREYNGYRWIEGKFGCKKNLVIQACLSTGQYYLVVMTEWKQTQNFEISLLVWANHHVGIQRERGSCEEMIQQACMDLAQRKGKINQLSPTLCSYNYICPRTALVIENINNEKLKESAIIKRNISGLPCSVPLLPLNKIFLDEGGKILNQVDIVIPKLSSFTIVLKMRGGIDQKLIKKFSEEDSKGNK